MSLTPFTVPNGQVASWPHQTGLDSSGNPETIPMGGSDANGNALPSLIQPVVFQGPPAPPLAVQLVQNATPTAQNNSILVPSDPGSASVSF